MRSTPDRHGRVAAPATRSAHRAAPSHSVPPGENLRQVRRRRPCSVPGGRAGAGNPGPLGRTPRVGRGRHSLASRLLPQLVMLAEDQRKPVFGRYLVHLRTFDRPAPWPSLCLPPEVSNGAPAAGGAAARRPTREACAWRRRGGSRADSRGVTAETRETVEARLPEREVRRVGCAPARRERPRRPNVGLDPSRLEPPGGVADRVPGAGRLRARPCGRCFLLSRSRRERAAGARCR